MNLDFIFPKSSLFEEEGLSGAIADAARELTTQVPPKDESEENNENTEENTEETEEQPATENLTETELAEAQRLYRALKDPKTSGQLIAALAWDAGILKQGQQALLTPKQEEKQIKAVKDILTESLGKEYAFLSDRLGPAIEKVLEQERESQQEQFESLQQANLANEINSTLSELAKETKGESRKLENRMAELMKEILPAEGVSLDSYIRRIYRVAISEKSGTGAKPNVNKIRQNAADVPGRLQSSSAVHETVIPPKKMKLNEAVSWAAKELMKGKK